MPAGSYPDLRKWGQELEQQAKRVKWDTYDWAAAARDALIYQCPDTIWRNKIIRDKMPFRTALDWGINNVVTKKAGQKLILIGAGVVLSCDHIF